jgi:hypothetical protein
MGVQAVVAEAYSEASAHPVEEQRYGQVLPTKCEKGRDGAHVNRNQSQSGGPVQFVVNWQIDDLGTQKSVS